MGIESSEEMVTVATFLRPETAHLVRGLLESEGIECFMEDEVMTSLVPLIPDIMSGGVKLRVRVVGCAKCFGCNWQNPRIILRRGN